jgi:hypothetical protein
MSVAGESRLNIINGDGARGQIDCRALNKSSDCSLGHAVNAPISESGTDSSVTVDKDNSLFIS